LGLLFFGGGGAFAQNYTQIFTDNFNRPDTTTVDLEGGREQTPNKVFSIVSNQLSTVDN
jgi:hypothetical protein